MAQETGKRIGRPRALAASLPLAARKTLRKHGFAEAGVVTDWPTIVGPLLSAHSAPQRLAFPRGTRQDGTLHVLVSGPFSTELQHLEPVVIERINGYFGYRAVARLRLVQGVLPMPRPRRRRASGEDGPALDPVSEAELEKIEVPELRAALERLGKAVRARTAETDGGPKAGTTGTG
ncbi:MAG: DUF721 domain-containing protein [Rhodospirillaceae bacterium]|jgi:hypothetical protein|nr:DUF721 domain-containing protein [Rhodospirillaceae bacterium]MBT6117299.1 DUF721 domain-containing protein [Rhodospirillaceae bacterium]